MGYDIGRAALACLSVLAVVVAASQFPAAGLGEYPGGIGDSTGGVAGSAPVGGGDRGEVPAGETTPGERSTPTEESKPTTTDGTATSTDTETETRTETDDAVAAGDDGGISGVVGGILFLVVGIPMVLGAVLTGGMAIGVVGVGRTGPEDRLVVNVAGTELDLGGGLRGLSQASMAAVLGLSSSTARLVGGLGETLGKAGAGLSSLGSGGGRSLASLPGGMARGLADAGRGVGGAVAAISGGFGSLFSGIGSFGRGWSEGSAPSDDARSLGQTSTADDDNEADGQRPPPQTVEEAWERFVETVPLRNPQARTPGEYARVAVGRGLPADAVGRLTRTFREIRYGPRRSDGNRLERARAAWARIRHHETEEDES